MGAMIGTVGLSLDIVGVVWLFFCASTKKIEAEMSCGAMRDFTDEMPSGESP